MTEPTPLLEVRGLLVRYDPRRATDRAAGVTLPPAVDGIDFEVHRGECFGLIGSSGCGKTSTARAILGLVPFDGSIRFDGREVRERIAEGRRGFAGRVQLVMQNPGASLTPRMRIGAAIDEVLKLHDHAGTSVRELLELVGLGLEHADRYPHQLSGGEQQRVALARALAVDPELLVLDEPVSSLDPVRQAEIVDLLLEVQSIRSLTYLFIAHDLGLVSRLCGRLAVMRRGRIVEAGETSKVFSGAKDPFTRELLAASPGGIGAGSGENTGV